MFHMARAYCHLSGLKYRLDSALHQGTTSGREVAVRFREIGVTLRSLRHRCATSNFRAPSEVTADVLW